ncbi:FAD-dependent oxidoreductase [Alkalinema sp. FACHB-956]|uniref:FAD-dependent oxidoreductase n=1 Tax=Alkalinema sp. FACHB-956 TaxID=2692768 RepID=UPI0016859FF2|nr:NAD(P)/FAD-dependent oxidoreductase [Alkalinema sp. FACHB-956]
MKQHPVVVIGAGPAGLTAAYELVKNGVKPLVLERSDQVGGIARTEVYKGYRFDIGGHRFFTKVDVVNQLWQEVMGDEFIKVPRLSRIYYNGDFFNYPLELLDTLGNLGIRESAKILLSYLKVKARPIKAEATLEDWVTNRFGRRLFRTFFKTYTEKVWGIECDKIEADWAAQRIKGLSLRTAVMNAIFKVNNTKTLIKEFDYPRLGPGQMWERFQQAIEARGGQVAMNTGVVQINRKGNRICSITTRQAGETLEIPAEQFISSMPVTALVQRLNPPAPPEVLEAARSLNYRAFIIVPIVIDRADLFPDNWIYIHSPQVKVGRIQNFKNWSPAMVPDPSKTCLGMEYFCSEGDALWEMSDTELLDLATREVAALGLAPVEAVEDGTVIRQPKAYPVYDRDYRQHLQVIQNFLGTIENLQTIGRNGMHRYNNQDHSMLTAVLAARNLFGESHDLWEVNTERSYHESFTQADWQAKKQQQRTTAAARSNPLLVN